MDALLARIRSGGTGTAGPPRKRTLGASSNAPLYTWGLLILAAFSTGCSCWQVGRRTDFVLTRNARREATVYRGWALEALECQYEAGDVSKHYADGFVSGFVDHVFAGGRGKPPLIAPLPFRGPGPAGRERNHEWREGFREGAEVAIRGGYVEQALRGGVTARSECDMACLDNDIVHEDASCSEDSCTTDDGMFEIGEEITTPFSKPTPASRPGPSHAIADVPVPSAAEFMNDDDPLPGSTMLDEPVPPAPSALDVEIDSLAAESEFDTPHGEDPDGEIPIGSGAANPSDQTPEEDNDKNPFGDDSPDWEADIFDSNSRLGPPASPLENLIPAPQPARLQIAPSDTEAADNSAQPKMELHFQPASTGYADLIRASQSEEGFAVVQAMHAEQRTAPHAEPPGADKPPPNSIRRVSGEQVISPPPRTLPGRQGKRRTTEDVMRRSEHIFRDLDQVEEAGGWR